MVDPSGMLPIACATERAVHHVCHPPVFATGPIAVTVFPFATTAMSGVAGGGDHAPFGSIQSSKRGGESEVIAAIQCKKYTSAKCTCTGPPSIGFSGSPDQ